MSGWHHVDSLLTALAVSVATAAVIVTMILLIECVADPSKRMILRGKKPQHFH